VELGITSKLLEEREGQLARMRSSILSREGMTSIITVKRAVALMARSPKGFKTSAKGLQVRI
jgi:hypothetical protein